MKKYFYYFKNDHKKIPMGFYDGVSQEDALKHFSKLKGLNLKKFLIIYNVTTLNDNSNL
jgi:hypothetical protein